MFWIAFLKLPKTMGICLISSCATLHVYFIFCTSFHVSLPFVPCLSLMISSCSGRPNIEIVLEIHIFCFSCTGEHLLIIPLVSFCPRFPTIAVYCKILIFMQSKCRLKMQKTIFWSTQDAKTHFTAEDIFSYQTVEIPVKLILDFYLTAYEKRKTMISWVLY